ncbi:MAG: hypothetical protein ACPGFC_08715 [Paracoccaceae bacterium]
MRFTSVRDLVRRSGPLLRDGPLAIIMAEDAVDLRATVDHHLRLGFARAVVLAPADMACDVGAAWRVDADTQTDDALSRGLSPILSAAAGAWIYWGYQGEFLTFPFADTRTVRDLLAFHTEERRTAMAGVVIDLFGPTETEHIDTCGYFTRPGPTERDVAIYGGLRRRMAPHVPPDRHRIDRIPLVRGARGLSIDDHGRLSDPERNTRACPWHANLTCAVLSRRTARALARTPSAQHELGELRWAGSAPYSGAASQIVALGLMEAGQWF